MEVDNFRTCDNLRFALNNSSGSFSDLSLYKYCPACLSTSVIEPRHARVSNFLRSIGFYRKKESSFDNTSNERLL